MKLFTSLLFYVLSIIPIIGSEMTNGIFYIDTPCERRLIEQSGRTATNQLIAGKTYIVDNNITELEFTNKSVLYFIGGNLIIGVNSNSILSIDLLEQEIDNLDAVPSKAIFGKHNLNLTLTRGEFTILYSNTNKYSMFNIVTPHMIRKCNSGTYVFTIDEKSTLMIAFSGNSQIRSKSNTEKTSNPLSIEQNNTYSPLISELEKKRDNVQFFIVDHIVVGIRLK